MSSATSLLPRLCRTCGRTSRQAKFATKHRCKGCADDVKALRAERIAARGPRVASAVREETDVNPKHLAWIRKLVCVSNGSDCQGPLHAHHVRANTGAATGFKPADRWCVPICGGHHRELHQHGARTYEIKYSVDLRSMAMKLAAASPHLKTSM
jgi:hypothetical protein